VPIIITRSPANGDRIAPTNGSVHVRAANCNMTHTIMPSSACFVPHVTISQQFI
jgi:hypothetical protein